VPGPAADDARSASSLLRYERSNRYEDSTVSGLKLASRSIAALAARRMFSCATAKGSGLAWARPSAVLTTAYSVVGNSSLIWPWSTSSPDTMITGIP